MSKTKLMCRLFLEGSNVFIYKIYTLHLMQIVMLNNILNTYKIIIFTYDFKQ